MEYNLNGYWNQGDGNKGGDRKEEEKRIENISATECLPEYFYAFLFYAVCIR